MIYRACPGRLMHVADAAYEPRRAPGVSGPCWHTHFAGAYRTDDIECGRRGRQMSHEEGFGYGEGDGGRECHADRRASESARDAAAARTPPHREYAPTQRSAQSGQCRGD